MTCLFFFCPSVFPLDISTCDFQDEKQMDDFAYHDIAARLWISASVFCDETGCVACGLKY